MLLTCTPISELPSNISTIVSSFPTSFIIHEGTINCVIFGNLGPWGGGVESWDVFPLSRPDKEEGGKMAIVAFFL